jgi:nitroreductase
MKLPDVVGFRETDFAIEPIFFHRWSPRAMSGDTISDAELMSLFEAARWAPSSYNEQPWRMLYAKREGPHWSKFLDFLVEANRVWVKEAGALVVFTSCKIFSRNGKPNPVNVFDAGSAWENFALQGAKMGLVVHGMAGFDSEKVRVGCHVPNDYSIIAMAAVGRAGDPAKLPENLRSIEAPSGRKAVKEIAWEGGFSQ